MRLLNLKSNIAQILILVVVLPVFAAVFPIHEFLDEFIREIPIFEVWADLLSDVSSPGVDTALTVYTSCFIEALVMGLSVHIMCSVGKKIGVRGFMILPTFLGICVGIALVNFLGVAEGASFIIYAVLVIAGILLMLKGAFLGMGIFGIKDVLNVVVDGLIAVIMCGYITALKMLSIGAISVEKMLVVLGLAIGALIANYVLSLWK